MRKTFTAGLTALSLVLIPAAPVQADNNRDETRAILGLLAVGALGLAIANGNNSQPSISIQKTDNRLSRQERFRREQLRLEQQRLEQRRRNQITRSQHVNTRKLPTTRRADPLPANCFRQANLRGGRTQSVFTSRCLDRQYRDASSLPRECLTRLAGRDEGRLGYSASCLNDRGFRSDRRR